VRARGRIQIPDVLIGGAVSIALLGAAPAYQAVIGDITAEAGPLSELLLELVVPFMFIGVIVSLGVSARRRA
jgi:hypothetical protein